MIKKRILFVEEIPPSPIHLTIKNRRKILMEISRRNQGKCFACKPNGHWRLLAIDAIQKDYKIGLTTIPKTATFSNKHPVLNDANLVTEAVEHLQTLVQVELGKWYTQLSLLILFRFLTKTVISCDCFLICDTWISVSKVRIKLDNLKIAQEYLDQLTCNSKLIEVKASIKMIWACKTRFRFFMEIKKTNLVFWLYSVAFWQLQYISLLLRLWKVLWNSGKLKL